MKLYIGEHLVSPRNIYTHHGLYIGDNKVIHYSGLGSGIHTGSVEETTLDKFQAGNSFRIKKHPKCKYDPDEIVARARSRIGEDCYNLLSNNCEHFVNWCIDGDQKSEQVDLVVVGSKALINMKRALKLAKKAKPLVSKELLNLKSISKLAIRGAHRLNIPLIIMDTYRTIKTVIKDADLTEMEAKRIEDLCQKSIDEIKKQTEAFNQQIDTLIRQKRIELESLMSSFEQAFNKQKYWTALNILAELAVFFGQELKFASFEEFDKFMNDKNSKLSI